MGEGHFPAQKLVAPVRASVSLTLGSSLMPWGALGWAMVAPKPPSPSCWRMLMPTWVPQPLLHPGMEGNAASRIPPRLCHGAGGDAQC